MGFLRRLLGGGEGREASPDREADGPDAATDDAAYERELLLDEARRLDDDLIQRQLRFADRSWTPPAQGGTRRADDEDAEGDAGR